MRQSSAVDRLTTLLAVAVLAAACAGAPDGSPSSPDATSNGGTAPSSAAPPSAAPSPAASTPAERWVRLAWEEVEPPAIPPHSFMISVIRSGRGTLVRVLERPDSPTVRVLVTTDGRTWERQDIPSSDVPFGASVDGGADWLQTIIRPDDDPGVNLLASADGREWELRGHLPAELGRAALMDTRGRTIVACSGDAPARCGVSIDGGADWSLIGGLDEPLSTADREGLVSTGDRFMLLLRDLDGRSVATSADGVAWTVEPAPQGLADASLEVGGRLAAIGDTFVLSATAFDGREFTHGLWVSGDGGAWRRVPLPRIVAWSTWFESPEGALVALGADGRDDEIRCVDILVSGDGVTWRSDEVPTPIASTLLEDWIITPTPGGLLAVNVRAGTALLGRPVATGDPGPPAALDATPPPVPSGAPPPTIAWTPGATFEDGAPSDVVPWAGGYLAVGSTEGTDGRIGAAAWTSTDGLTWTRTLDPATFPDARMVAVAARGQVLVAAGWSHRPGAGEDASPVAVFWRSRDGRTWERAPDRADLVIGIEKRDGIWRTGLHDVVAGGPGFVAVGATRSGGATVWASVDGLDWHRAATLGEAVITGVAVTSDGMVAVGSTGGPHSQGVAWTSPDGIDWTPSTSIPDGEVGKVEAGGPFLVAGGWGPTIWRSSDGRTWEAAPDQPSLLRLRNEEGISALVGYSSGFVGLGTTTCAETVRPCAAAWVSADGRRWDKVVLPTDATNPVALPGTAAMSQDTIVVLGSVPDGQGWNSWVGRFAP